MTDFPPPIGKPATAIFVVIAAASRVASATALPTFE